MNNLKSYLIPVSESLSKDYITKNAVVNFFNKNGKLKFGIICQKIDLKKERKLLKNS